MNGWHVARHRAAEAEFPDQLNCLVVKDGWMPGMQWWIQGRAIAVTLHSVNT